MQAIKTAVVNTLNEIVGKILEVHILNNNSVTLGGNIFVHEITLVIFSHPCKLILTLLACSMLFIFMLLNSSFLICREFTIVAWKCMELFDVSVELLSRFTDNCALVTRVVMIIFLMFFNVINSVKGVSTF